jgi:hypothetical protein
MSGIKAAAECTRTCENSSGVGNPTFICQIMTIDDFDGYEMCRASPVMSRGTFLR